ncbi:MAG: AEC family transporter [Cyanothece sp. SIO2G6]|nr:AEC family transporter [Cyanothece sp. SIO2G6]
MSLNTRLLSLYGPLILWVSFGWLLGRTLPARVPQLLGKGLFWVGVPIGIAIFLRQADLSGKIWLAPAIAWLAVGTGAALSHLWIQQPWSPMTQWISQKLGRSLPPVCEPRCWSPAERSSFMNASMLGNTGYLGYPIILTLVPQKYFAWAVFYDTLGSTLASYGLAVVLASHIGQTQKGTSRKIAEFPTLRIMAVVQQIGQTLIKTPALWGFTLGLSAKSVHLPQMLETGLQWGAWGVISSALLLLGMRLSQLDSWHHLRPAIASLGIKMLITPLIIGLGLKWMGLETFPLMVLVLQMGMPPAFATLIIAEAYGLERNLTVTTLAIGSVIILTTLPIWLILFEP